MTRCNRAKELRDAVNAEYRELLAKESARMRAEQVRAIVEEHFRSTAQMLGDMAEEFEQYQRFDEDSAEQVREVLRHRELTPIEVCCRIDKFGRMTIEANICRTHGVHINKGQLTREISGGCGRTFTQPSVTASGTEWLCDLIANYEDDDPQALSERIVERAVKDRADGHEDDVSAVVLLIE